MNVYWRLSAFYLFYFATLGALVPYWAVYLESLGFSAVAIGQLVAIIVATKIVAPNLWGWVADRTGRRMHVIRAASFLAFICFLGVFLGESFWWLALTMSAFSFFWNAALPQFEAVTLNHLGDDTNRYSRIRLWGSIGFIFTVAGLGPLLDRYGVRWLLLALALLLLAIACSTLAVREAPPAHPSHESGSLRRLLSRREIRAFLLVCFLVQISHGPYYTFYSIYLESAGYARGTVGLLWALGVVAEIGVFVCMPWLGRRYSVRGLLTSALALTALRWCLIGWGSAHTGVLVFAQCLHAASFGVYHALAIHLVHQFFRGSHQGRGQALYSSISFGAGGALGSLLSGYLWAGIGPAWTYTAASGAALAAWFIARRGIPKESPGV